MNRVEEWKAYLAGGLYFSVFAFLSLETQGQQGPVSAEELSSRELGTLSDALASFEVADGFRIEAVAWEPLVVDPVAMAFDEWGRLYVVECETIPSVGLSAWGG